MDLFERWLIFFIVTSLLGFGAFKFIKGWGVGRRTYIFVSPKKASVISRISLGLMVFGLLILEIMLIAGIVN